MGDRPNGQRNVRSKKSDEVRSKPWSRRDMEAAIPIPMPDPARRESDTAFDTSLRIVDVHTRDHQVIVELSNLETASLSYVDFPRIGDATDEARSNWELVDGATRIRWPSIPEEIGLETLVAWADSRDR